MTSIAIVDNVKSNRQILSKIIESIDSNIAVYDFDRVEPALGWIANQTPDLVITDYKLPGVDGIGFIERLRSRSKSPEIPILMITIADDLLLPVRARRLGATAFLRRPVDHRLVRARIESLLRSRRRPRLVVDNSQARGPA